MRRAAAWGTALLLASCTVDRSIDPKLILTGCTSNADCPGKQTCQPTRGFSYCTATGGFTVEGPVLTPGPWVGPKSQLRARYATSASVTGTAMLIGPGGILVQLTAEPDLRFLLEGAQVAALKEDRYTLFSFFRDASGTVVTGPPVDVEVDATPPGSRAPRFDLAPAPGSLADQFALAPSAAGPRTTVTAQLILDEEADSRLALLGPDGGEALVFDAGLVLTPPADPSLPQGPLTARLTVTDRAGNARTDDYPGVVLDTVVPSLASASSTLTLAPWGTLDDPTPISRVDVSGLPEPGELVVFQGPFSVGRGTVTDGGIGLPLLQSSPPFDLRLVDRAGNESAPKAVSHVALTFTPRDIDPTDDERVLELRANQVAPRLIANPSLTTQPVDGGLTLSSAGAWRARPTTPGALSRMAIAFDGDREVAVAFGGNPSMSTVKANGTLEWQGQGWFRRTTPVAPPPATRDDVAMVYDSLREVVLLFYGMTGETWSWNGDQWKRIAVVTGPDSAPAKRTGFAMAFDKRAGNVVLFGGAVGMTTFNDTWVWNGLAWKRLTPPTSPEGRAGHSMAYHPPSGGVVMFGDDKRSFGDVWWWDGLAQTWLRQPGPGALFDPAMVFDDNELKLQAIDLATGKVHALRGSSDGGGLSGFAWDAGGTDLPSATPNATAFFDSARRTLVLANADRRWSLKPAETMPSGWTTFGTSRPPQPTDHHAIAWNDGADTYVMFGGRDSAGVPTNETYCFGAEGWQQGFTDGGEPPARWGHTLTAISPTTLILHGGFNAAGVPLQDTWQFTFANRSCNVQWIRRADGGERGGHFAVWDEAEQRLVVWGADGGAVYENDAGGVWNPLTVPAAPGPGGFFAAAAWDTRQDRILAAGGGAFSGGCGLGTCRPGTFALTADAGTWTSLPTALNPARKGHALWFDTYAGSAFTFGGLTASVGMPGMVDPPTLARLTTAWLAPPVGDLESDFEPAERAFHAMAYAPENASALLFGGAVNGVPVDDTWDFQIAKQRPAVVFHVDLNRFVFKPFGRVAFTDLKVEAIAGGEGVLAGPKGGQTKNGAEVQGYFDGRWQALPNESVRVLSPGTTMATAQCSLQTTKRLDELLVGNRRLSVAVTPVGESGDAAAQLKVDRLSVRVSFDLP